MTRRLALVLVLATAGLGASVVAVAKLRGRGASGERAATVAVAARTDTSSPRRLAGPPIPPASPSPAFFDAVKPPDPELRSAAGGGDEALERVLGASGRDDGAWTERARDVFVAMKTTIPPPLLRQILVKKMSCYRAACMLEVGYSSRQVFDQTRGGFLAADGFRGWRAAKGHGAVEVTRTGAAKVSWLLANPGRTRHDGRSRTMTESQPRPRVGIAP